MQTTKDLLTRSELVRLTDELRAQALHILPPERGFTIMTRENINAMLPPGRTIEQCEGSCLVETGRNINAEYIAQGRVSLFGKKLSLTVELYETLGSKLLGTFSAEGTDAEDLLSEIKKNGPALFGNVPGALSFGSSYSGAAGISGLNSGAGYSAAFGAKKYIVNVSTNPNGAFLSLDGIPVPSCKGTPCNVEMTEGVHRVIASLDLYRAADTSVSAEWNEQRVQIKLVPDFGTLSLYPRLLKGVGDENNLSITIDGLDGFSTGEIRLSPGQHFVKVTHHCYEDISFTANIAVDGTVTFDSLLVPKNGGIGLRAERNGEPQAVPVWLNGDSIGVTPWSGTVPVCVSLAVGAEQESVQVEYQKDTSYVYEVQDSDAQEEQYGDTQESGNDYSEDGSGSAENENVDNGSNYSSSSSYDENAPSDSYTESAPRVVNTGFTVSPWFEGAVGLEVPLGRVCRKYGIEHDSSVFIPDMALALRVGYIGRKVAFLIGGGVMFYGVMGTHVDSSAYSYYTTSENVWIYKQVFSPLGQVELRVAADKARSDTTAGGWVYGLRGTVMFPGENEKDGYWALYRLGGFVATGGPVLYIGLEIGGECAWRRGGGMYFSLLFEH